jgi:hypothetical protein
VYRQEAQYRVPYSKAEHFLSCSQPKFINVQQILIAVCQIRKFEKISFKPLYAELNPICHLLALLVAHRILHVSGMRVNIILNTS